jgi:hypothetical protein
MSLGHAPTQGDVLRSTGFCHERVSPTSIDALLHAESHRLFPEEDFGDQSPRPSGPHFPPVVMVSAFPAE